MVPADQESGNMRLGLEGMMEECGILTSLALESDIYVI
jgi:hypothetical protein